jgi:hypothetical protein
VRASVRTIHFTLTICTVALALGGCGEDEGPNAKKFDGEGKDVAAVVDRLMEASRGGDTQVICGEIFSVELSQRLARESGSCTARVESDLVAEDAEFLAEQIDVEGDVAAAQVAQQDGGRFLLRFEREEGGWRISRIRSP